MPGDREDHDSASRRPQPRRSAASCARGGARNRTGVLRVPRKRRCPPGTRALASASRPWPEARTRASAGNRTAASCRIAEFLHNAPIGACGGLTLRGLLPPFGPVGGHARRYRLLLLGRQRPALSLRLDLGLALRGGGLLPRGAPRRGGRHRCGRSKHLLDIGQRLDLGLEAVYCVLAVSNCLCAMALMATEITGRAAQMSNSLGWMPVVEGNPRVRFMPSPRWWAHHRDRVVPRRRVQGRDAPLAPPLAGAPGLSLVPHGRS